MQNFRFLLLLSVVVLQMACSTRSFAVKLGQERLVETQFSKLLHGKRVGVLAHHASRDYQGQHIVDRLAALAALDGGVQLKMIFAPEHGYRSLNDELTPDSKDPQTGLPVYSLYGPRQAPTKEMLSNLDVVVIDLQDVGLRYYTYPATMVFTMKACKEAGVAVVILDRPNPLGGEMVEGAVLEKSLTQGGLTNLAPIPTRHGMTFGELANYFNSTLQINANLTVVPMSDYKRSMTWQETKLKWTPPSPALTTLDQALMYGIFGALEAGKLAVGRGKTNELAFNIFGAPGVTSEMQTKLVQRLNALSLEGLRFSEYSWTPSRAIFEGKFCRGFRVDFAENAQILQLKMFDSMVRVLQVMKETLEGQWDLSGMATLIGARWVIQGVTAKTDPAVLSTRARADYEKFLRDRAGALLY